MIIFASPISLKPSFFYKFNQLKPLFLSLFRICRIEYSIPFVYRGTGCPQIPLGNYYLVCQFIFIPFSVTTDCVGHQYCGISNVFTRKIRIRRRNLWPLICLIRLDNTKSPDRLHNSMQVQNILRLLSPANSVGERTSMINSGPM